MAASNAVAKAAAKPLFQRRTDGGERIVELGTDALNRRNDRERDTAGNQAIFDGRRGGPVTKEF